MTDEGPPAAPGDSHAMEPRPRLQVIIASTRPGRIGLPVGRWAYERSVTHGSFEVELVDLAEVNLPLLDEPNHPRLSDYTQEHTRRFSAIISRADAFVFVVPEYNYGCSPTIVNALDYLYHEWLYKPVGLVSYGGISGGTRGVQMLKQVLTTLKMPPLPEAVSIPFVQQYLEEGVFEPNELAEESVVAMLTELARWTAAMRPLRQQPAS